MPCPGPTWGQSWRWTHLPTPTERLKLVSPVPAACYIVLPVSGPQETAPAETAGCSNTRRLPPETPAVSLWAVSAAPRQTFAWRVPSNPPPGYSSAACGSPGSHPHAASQRSP